MKPSVQLSLNQQLTLTPQLQQAIKLLQLSSLELRTEIQLALESNPMLEALEDEQNTAEDDPEDLTSLSSNNEEDGDNIQDLPEELPVDSLWDEVYISNKTSSSDTRTTDSSSFENRHHPGTSLRDHLVEQIRLSPLTPLDFAIATALIDSIGEDGILTSSPQDIVDSITDQEEPIGVDEVEAVLHLIQQFDPPGIGARDLSECLSLQLERLPPSTLWVNEAKILVKNYMDLMANHDYKKLCRVMKLEPEDLHLALKLIQSLNPRPGSQITNSEPQYIVPDVTVKKVKGRWQVELNSHTMPKIKINQLYASFIQRRDNSNDNLFLRNQLQEARWLLKSLQSRNDTLLKVSTCIVKHQQNFLEYGEEAMKPMILHDIALDVEMHESTVSRVTTQKFMHTPRGIFELKYFFSSHVSTSSGGECSSTAIRALIKKLITAENPSKPLSDNKIAQLLAGQGVEVARRTVAKYRESMAIPPSNERKCITQ